jgi:hypothetical protein
MHEIWEQVLREFCKLDVLCWYGEPNGWGWLAMGIVLWLALMLSVFLLAGVYMVFTWR